jgi:lipopolysaccharide transport system permease protein
MQLILEPGRAAKNYWRDLWHYRELFYFLAWRDILVRYKQTVIGIAWAIIQPLLMTVVLTFVFSRMGRMSAPHKVPFFLMVMAAQLPWQFFSASLSQSSNSLVANANLISKIYFPRLIVPSASVITSFVDFMITVGLLAVAMLCYRFTPDWRLLALPLFVALAFGAAFGAGLWLCALNVKYRDFRYIIPFIVQFGFFLSPVGYQTSYVPENWLWHGWQIPARLLYSLNPMVGVIDGFRWSLLQGRVDLWWPSIVLSIFVTLELCLSGIWYFRRTEKTFADII